MTDDESRQLLATFLNGERNALSSQQLSVWPLRRDPYSGSIGLGHSDLTQSIFNALTRPIRVLRGESDPGDVAENINFAGMAISPSVAMRGKARLGTSDNGNRTPRPSEATTMEEVAANERFGNRPTNATFGVPDDLTKSSFWPKEWSDTAPGQRAHEYAKAFALEEELRSRWNAITEPIMYPNGVRAMSRNEAEAIAMNTHSSLGDAYQKSSIERLNARHRMDGTKPASWDYAWHGYDRPLGAPEMTREEMMQKVAVPSVILPGGITGEKIMAERAMKGIGKSTR